VRLSSRYSDLERRAIEYFVDNPQYDTIFLRAACNFYLAIR
jgi:hypothetical protein